MVKTGELTQLWQVACQTNLQFNLVRTVGGLDVVRWGWTVRRQAGRLVLPGLARHSFLGFDSAYPGYVPLTRYLTPHRT